MCRYTSIILEIYIFIKKIQPWQLYIYILLVEGVGVHGSRDQGPRPSCFGGLTHEWKRWQTCKILGVWILKESRENSSLHPLPREDSSMAKILETQDPTSSLFLTLSIFLPFFFFSSPPPSLPLDLDPRAAKRRPARVASRSSELVSRFLPSFTHFSNLHLLWFIDLDLLALSELSFDLFILIFFEISWLVKVCSGLILTLRLMR